MTEAEKTMRELLEDFKRLYPDELSPNLSTIETNFFRYTLAYLPTLFAELDELRNLYEMNSEASHQG